MTPQEFRQKQSLPYEAKVNHAIIRAQEFYNQMQGEVYCSVGGLDSIVLLSLLRREVSKDIPGVSVSSLEDKSIQQVHRQFNNMTILQPIKSKVQVIKEYGFPVVSKEKARKISHLQKPDNPKQTYIHAIMTGDMGEQGGYKHSDKIKLPEKWIKLFGGLYAEHRADIDFSRHLAQTMHSVPVRRLRMHTA